MGLAASQARLLMLTSRKSDVEGQLMSIAMQKLSLSRESSEASSKYSAALNSTTSTLTYGSSGTALSYALLMAPNSSTSAQYLMTDYSSGAVLLNDTYAGYFGSGDSQTGAQAAAACSRESFLQKAMPSTVTSSNAASYVSGYAGTVAKTTDTDENYTKMNTTINSIASFVKGVGKADINTGMEYNVSKFSDLLGSLSTEIDKSIQNITGMSDSEMSSMNWLTLAYTSGGKANYLRCASDMDSSKKGTAAYYDKDEKLQKQTVTFDDKSDGTGNAIIYNANSQVDYLVRMKRAVLAAQNLLELYTVNSKNQSGEPAEIITACISLLMGGGSLSDVSTKDSKNNPEAEIQSLLNECNDSADAGDDVVQGETGVSFTYDTKWGQFDSGFLDFDYDGVLSYTRGGAAAYQRGENTIFTEDLATLFDKYSDDRDYQAEKASTSPLSDQAKANFYINLYNAVIQKGWKKDSQLSNNSHVEELLSSGTANLYQFSSSSTSSAAVLTSVSSGVLTEVEEDDETAITKAKADYSKAKGELDYKESILDVQQNNLDTERSAIQTELESVQAIIDSNIKIFKMFSSSG